MKEFFTVSFSLEFSLRNHCIIYETVDSVFGLGSKREEIEDDELSKIAFLKRLRRKPCNRIKKLFWAKK